MPLACRPIGMPRRALTWTGIRCCSRTRGDLNACCVASIDGMSRQQRAVLMAQTGSLNSFAVLQVQNSIHIKRCSHAASARTAGCPS